MIDYSNLTKLETTGYVLIPNFLSDNELEIICQDYNTTEVKNNNNYVLRYVTSESAKGLLESKIASLLEKVKEFTKLNVDLIVPGSIYTDTEHIQFPWHQDHESFYFIQQSFEYLNFYITVVKPNSKLSGISVIPLDKLEDNIPNEIHKFINGGATRFEPTGNTTTVADDNNGTVYSIPLNIDSIAESPEVRPGDLLLIRGDVIHKTQDNLTKRVALSIRASSSSCIINKKKLLLMCPVKEKILSGNKKSFDTALQIFDIHGSDDITVAEFYRIKDELFRKSNRPL